MSGELTVIGSSGGGYHGEVEDYPVHQAGDGFTTPIDIGTGGISVMEYTVVGGVLAQLRYRLEVGAEAELGEAFWVWKTDSLPFDLAAPGTDVDAVGQNSSQGFGTFNDPAFTEGGGLYKLNHIFMSVSDLSGFGVAKPVIGGSHSEGDNTMGALNIGPAVPYGAPPAAGAVLYWSILAPLA